MQGTILIVLSGVISVGCLKSQEVKKQPSCLLQVRHSREDQAPEPWIPHDILEPYMEQVKLHSKHTRTQGYGGNLSATVEGEECGEGDDSYQPSELEQGFSENVQDWTKDDASLCEHLGSQLAFEWVNQNGEGTVTSESQIFSRFCKQGQSPQLIEPIAGILRDPRPICDGYFPKMYNIDWLVLADKGAVNESSKKILFDAGGTRFMDAMNFFTSQYERMGIELDEIYVWEAEEQGEDSYWKDTPKEVREKWQPKLTFFDGTPVSEEEEDEHNPVQRLLFQCQPDDFCALKLDLDDPSVEVKIVQQLLQREGAVEVLDEFFYEHHVDGENREIGWDDKFLVEAYDILTELRKRGVRAHSWI